MDLKHTERLQTPIYHVCNVISLGDLVYTANIYMISYEYIIMIIMLRLVIKFFGVLRAYKRYNMHPGYRDFESLQSIKNIIFQIPIIIIISTILINLIIPTSAKSYIKMFFLEIRLIYTILWPRRERFVLLERLDDPIDFYLTTNFDLLVVNTCTYI